MRRLRCGLGCVFVVCAAVSCGGGGAFVTTSAATQLGPMDLSAPLPPSAGPGLGPAHPFFVDPRHGYVATTGGAWYVPKSGVQPPLALAEIDATNDGGETWRTLVRVPRSAFDAVAFSGLRGLALGAHVLSRAAVVPVGRGQLATFALATDDGGARWREAAAPYTASATPYPTAGAIPVALQVFPHVVYAELGGHAKRSRDGGRSWQSVTVPRAARLVRYVSPLVGYAGVGALCHGGETLWRTSDGGDSWRLVPGSCGPALTDVEAHGRVVVTAQASYTLGGAERSLLRLSLDGGVTWRVVLDTGRWRAVAFTSFTDGRRGVAVSAEDEQGFQLDQLHVTRDGGRTWILRREPFAPVTQFGPAPTQPAFAGDRIWAGEPNDGLLWHSGDLGRTWTVSARPQYLGLRRLLAVHGRTLLVDTDAGALRSNNSGNAWHPVRRPKERADATTGGAPAYLASLSGLEGAAYVRERAGWRRLQPPTIGVGAVAFANATHGLVASGQGDGYGRLPVAATSDGGHSWRMIRVPPGVQRGDHADLGPGVIALIESPILYISLDDGHHWRQLRIPRTIFDCQTANYSGEVWLACGGPGSGPTLLLRSTDGGRRWTSRRTPLSLIVTPVASAEAWAAPASAFRAEQPQTLWHTTDGGDTWRAVWPRVSPPSRIPLGSH